VRRAEARKRRHKQRLIASCALLALIAAGVVGGVIATHVRGHKTVRAAAHAPQAPKPQILQPRPLPDEVRGVHVTMALAGLPGKINEYVAMKAAGLNAIELDVKDENGDIGFPVNVPLARKIGSAKRYYDAERTVATIHAAGLYLVGRVVTFEDPALSAGVPQFAIRRADGSRWLNSAGLGWTNPYDKRVWKYNVDIAVQAAKLGFDEIQFDYVRFPSDGDIGSIVYPRSRQESKMRTIERFLAYASKRLRPLGVRVSADLFGLAATRDLGVGQSPTMLGRHLDAIYPMVYPSHYVPGEYHLTDPEAFPGRTVEESLRDYRRAVRGSDVRIVPWLQDFSLSRTYGLAEVTDQVAAARRSRAGGFMLWNPLGVYTQEALSAR
jgi:hypothetical protein